MFDRNNSEKKNRILFLVQLPPPVHGVSITNKKVIESKKLLNSDIDFYILPLKFSDSIDNVDKLDAKKIIKTIVIAAKLFFQCLSSRPDFVYFTLSVIGNTFFRDVLYISILKFLRVNVVYHLHRVGVNEAGIRSKIRHYLYKWAFSNAWVIHLTPRLYDDISLYANRERCFFVSNGIDDPVGSSSKVVDHSKKSPVHFTFLSHMVPEKGVIILLNALVELRRRGINFEATFAGGRMSHECESAFNELLPANNMEGIVRYIGPVYGKEKDELLAKADVFVFPSLYDSFGIVLLEAMAHSLPVVATVQGGIPDIVVDGETGYLVEKNNVLALADKMALLASSEKLRKEFGGKGRSRFELKYTTEVFERNMLHTLQKCLRKVALDS